MGLISSILLTIFLFFSNFQGIVPNPATGKKEIRLVSEEDEIATGTFMYPQLQMESGGAVQGAPRWVEDYVNALGHKVAAASGRPNLPYEFVILNNPEPNAWCLPGGKIAINSGLFHILKSEGQLAYILSHEVSHAAARHEARSLESEVLSLGANDGVQPVLAFFAQAEARHYEREADRLGIQTLQRAGYDPKAALQVVHLFMKNPDGKKKGVQFFATHPSNEERAMLTRQALKELPSGGQKNTQEFLAVKHYILEHDAKNHC